ncbi:hypothetical protein CASFOL_038238 [Castilleja foliolosa]|uniref:Late embryogenesis abundant protein LEA-2 subgroup domain-containing protein n=1 Tax=Castilleja foliolosa TaxID=1961234 RepID=A0ABD3BKW7_9LAMI
MHAKSDSETSTSLAPSSPDNNRRPVYYVQSPSRDSHDGEKTNATSFHSTPVMGSPVGSPPHSNSSVGRHSRESSTSRFSGSLKPGSRKISPNDAGSGGRGRRKGGADNWKEFDMIEEEGLLEDDDSPKGFPRRCYFPAFLVCFFVVFSIFALILYGVSKTRKPEIIMRSIKFERFTVQAGSDGSGVSTDMISVNASVNFNFRNKASFFGLHVSSTPVVLSYLELNIGSGDMKNFYEKRSDRTDKSVTIIGDGIPLYGSGATLSTPTGITKLPVPLKLDFTVRSRAYVLGKLVKPKFYKRVECSIIFDSKKLGAPISLKNSCTYD